MVIEHHASTPTQTLTPDGTGVPARAELPVIHRLCVIANPASGTDREALDKLSALLAEQPDLDWQLRLTEGSGDATRFAREAAEAGVDAVAVYGGDGTVMEAAAGLRETAVPLVILPGGTANVMSIELDIPQALEEAVGLMWSPRRRVRAVDMGCVDDDLFFLRAGLGYEAEISATAPREEKKRLGRLAYLLHALRKLRSTRPTRYTLTLDGQTVVARGVTCMICNSGSVGLPNVRMVHETVVDDGLLDVIVIRSVRPGEVLRVVGSLLGSLFPTLRKATPKVDHWQAREVTVKLARRQQLAADGEPLRRTRQVKASVLPGAVRVLVPGAGVSA